MQFSVNSSVLYTYSTVPLPASDQYIKQPFYTIYCTRNMQGLVSCIILL